LWGINVFKSNSALPIYSVVNQLDNCNFAAVTTWEGDITEGRNFQFDKNRPLGQQYVGEATDLSKISSDKYDFILSSHMLEHTANPLKALGEWTRVLKSDGILLLLIPHKDGTFDHKRPVTALEHIIEDFESGIKEDDLTHLPEILELHDLSKDPEAGSFESFKERSLKNFENRCLHQHVFDTNLAIQVLHHHRLQILAVETILPCHIILIAKKISSEETLNNEEFLSSSAKHKSSSPFAADKIHGISI
jgi:SAM-dependent methyltransferase